jgi:hypothetical protein
MKVIFKMINQGPVGTAPPPRFTPASLRMLMNSLNAPVKAPRAVQ